MEQKKIKINTVCEDYFGDLYTPTGIYLRLRDRFRDTVLLESSDFKSLEGNWSFIGVEAIAGFEAKNLTTIEFRFPDCKPQKKLLGKPSDVVKEFNDFLQCFEASGNCEIENAQSLFGYTSYDAVQFCEDIKLKKREHDKLEGIGLLRYRLYQYVIAIDHFKDKMWICENKIDGLESNLKTVKSYIIGKDIPVFPFARKGKTEENMNNDQYMELVKKGIASSHRGDVFQIVLSRRFEQVFQGDEFNVYRALRSINPSPYLFYFDYGDYKLFGSSPESQLIIENRQATLHPIAGTYKRTGNNKEDERLAEELLKDPKEKAEHVMLVDLARNDLSRHSKNVSTPLEKYMKVDNYSHLMHIRSEVTGNVEKEAKPFDILADTFPAGTLSGAPKYKAMQLIDDYEPTSRGFYGGAIGFIGLNGSCVHAIIIRSFLSRNNTLYYQAGAGVVATSNPESELQEVYNKLKALNTALEQAEIIYNDFIEK